ncbi:hypothetical protein HMPREF9072_00594 [Capnocytophaga sp. oral taxon 324 str. F0483]|nr:hypothetical protein HMPREF9072_00594 [Capnocytophaga sp. oral taxon 324 str. F0483]
MSLFAVHTLPKILPVRLAPHFQISSFSHFLISLPNASLLLFANKKLFCTFALIFTFN